MLEGCVNGISDYVRAKTARTMSPPSTTHTVKVGFAARDVDELSAFEAVDDSSMASLSSART